MGVTVTAAAGVLDRISGFLEVVEVRPQNLINPVILSKVVSAVPLTAACNGSNGKP
jgi:hypothetical protein